MGDPPGELLVAGAPMALQAPLALYHPMRTAGKDPTGVCPDTFRTHRSCRRLHSQTRSRPLAQLASTLESGARLVDIALLRRVPGLVCGLSHLWVPALHRELPEIERQGHQLEG